jgi:hypothetical protein
MNVFQMLGMANIPDKSKPDICGNNGQGDLVDNLYSKRVKSILTGHKQKHLHLYQINGQSRLGSSGADPIRVKQEYQTILIVKYRNGGK